MFLAGQHQSWAWALRATLGLAAAGTISLAVYIAADSPASLETLANVWTYNGVLLLCALTCLLRAFSSRELRGAWLAFGIGLAVWAGADIYWTVELREMRRIPYPSWADAGYLAAMPCLFAGIALLTKHRVGHFSAARWLDGAIASLVAVALGSALLAPALVGLTHGDTAAVLTNLAYPLSDLVLVAFVAGAVITCGRRDVGPFLLLGAGLIVWVGADALYLYQEATSSYEEGWLDLLWLIGALCIALTACLSVSERPAPSGRYRSSIWLPAVSASVAVGILVWDHFNRLGEVAVWLAGATLLSVAARLVLSFRENERLLGALEAEAVSDALTGLGNRRRLLRDLESALQDKTTSHYLALFDLDGFKSYNDRFGHPAGDALLSRLAERLERAASPGRAYRLGGDEFCVLAPQGVGPIGDLTEAARKSLTARGEAFSIGASCGFAVIPEEAETASDALGLVDQRMYTEKASRSHRVADQTHALLQRVLREREPALGVHLEDVADLAVELSRALDLDPENLDVVRRAAEMHDVGKIAIPDEILHKPGPLQEAEWNLIRTHTLIGERILEAAPALRPVAELVRASHEHWDGGGYPDGRAAEEIPLGARIILICDAWDAMTSERPYQRAMSEDQALAELRRCAGTQFDPRLIEVFTRLRVNRSRATKRQQAGAA